MKIKTLLLNCFFFKLTLPDTHENAHSEPHEHSSYATTAHCPEGKGKGCVSTELHFDSIGNIDIDWKSSLECTEGDL